jgi:Protein of unknown function (DUF3017)
MTHASHEQATAETVRARGRAGRHGGRRRRPGPARLASRAGRSQQPGGAGEAGQADQAAPARYQQLPYLLVLFGVVAALTAISAGARLVQGGTLVLAGVLLIAALARLILPDRQAGMLSSRRRFLDVAIFGVLGTGLLVAGLVVPVPG